ncbi:hypothetical protein ACOMHN_011653 [Nucella lapillus]
MAIDWISFAYAATVSAGGIIGYVKAGSLPSMVMGLMFGALIGVGACKTSKDPKNFSMSLATAAGLAVVMGWRFVASGKFMPAGLVTTLSLLMVARFGYRMYSQRSAQVRKD